MNHTRNNPRVKLTCHEDYCDYFDSDVGYDCDDYDGLHVGVCDDFASRTISGQLTSHPIFAILRIPMIWNEKRPDPMKLPRFPETYTI